jgi:hypothetical protein
MDTRLPEEFNATLNNAPMSSIPARYGSAVERGASVPQQAIPRAAGRARYKLPETIVGDTISLAAFLLIFFGGMFVAWGLS